VDQVISHYKHSRRWNGFQGDLKSFVMTKNLQNLQSQYVAGLAIENFGFVGITELYEESLELFNNRYKTNFECFYENANDYTVENLTDELLQLITNNNRQDFFLYDRCLKMHRDRWTLFQEDLPWVHGVIGSLTE